MHSTPSKTSATHFQSIYHHGFARIAACTPNVDLANPMANASHVISVLEQAHEQHVAVAVLPELCVSAYSIDDLLLQDALLEETIDAIDVIRNWSMGKKMLFAIGAPLAKDGRLYNCAVVLQDGSVLGVVPKSFLPNYREYYEKRHFASGASIREQTIDLGTLGTVPFGVDLLFEAKGSHSPKGLIVHVEICEDFWTPLPPSTLAALDGATVLLNLSASNITIGKGEARRDLCTSQSSRCIAAYAYSAAGSGESTNDLSWDGQAIISENGKVLAESPRFAPGNRLIVADVDLDLIRQERMRTGSFNDSRELHQPRFRRIRFGFDVRDASLSGGIGFHRPIDRFPFVPSDPRRLAEDCFEAYNIQVDGLVQRLRSSGIERIVLGVSGGLDSTHALIVAARAMDLLGLPRTNIHGFSLPGFATGDRTRSNATALMKSLGITAAEHDITEACRLMLRSLGHPAGDGKPVYDVTFENVQAGERTSFLFRKANQIGAIVLGTGDMSELALGWCTYGVGDHMSHYGVNAGVPKTLIQYLVRWVVKEAIFSSETGAILTSILGTAISPELVPVADGQPIQSSESRVGPYALQDFNLYYATRRGFSPEKIAFLAWRAWGCGDGAWPSDFPDDSKADVRFPELVQWLDVFVRRFFGFSQFKRTAIPNGPKVSSGGSLSPRGDWRAPSDAQADLWLRQIAGLPEDL